MKVDTPQQYTADYYCVDCGKGVSPHQANLSQNRTHEVGGCAGWILCRRCLDSEVRQW